jgi:hypothetical protein
LYLSQGVDYLGFLNAKLRDLEGWATLAYELVQNADDAVGATRIGLDVADAALIVSNDAQFSDCGSVHEPRCAWDAVGDGRKCCDFHAFRRVASGHKRLEEDTTGAFGIGFISVYQITDQPDLRSGQWHWRLDPAESEGRRIFAEKLTTEFPGTRFELPWARTPSALRTALGRPVLPSNVGPSMARALRNALMQAAPFLKRLSTLELKVDGKAILTVQCDRDASTDEILVVADGAARVWKRLKIDFEAEAASLRQQHHSRIEAKRSATVTVGVPLDDSLPEHGLLYAALPTEQSIALPVLVNADFYPSTDRKTVLFNGDYQGDWNRAAVRAAARAFAGALPRLRDVLKPAAFWQLLTRCRALHDDATEGAIDGCFQSFWLLAKPVVSAGEMVWTSRERFCAPSAARHNAGSKEAAECLPFFGVLGLNIVHPELRPHRNVLLEVGVIDLELDALTTAALASALTERRPLANAPEWLRSAANRRALASVVETLLQRVSKDKAATARNRLLDCSFWLTLDGSLAPASWLRLAGDVTRRLVSVLGPNDKWVADDNPPELLKLVDHFDLAGLVEVLEEVGAESIAAASLADASWLPKLLTWIDDRHIEVSQQPGLRSRLRQIALWPSGGELRTLDGLAVPGNFQDPLNLARLIDPSVAATFGPLLVNHLGAKSLNLRTYLLDYVPTAFGAAVPPPPQIRSELLRLVARHIGEIRDDDAVRNTLRALPMVPCEDGRFRACRQLYLRSDDLVSVLGDAPSDYVDPRWVARPGVVDVLRWLGAADIPRADDVLAHADEVTALGRAEGHTAARRLFEGLAHLWPHLVDQRTALSGLRTRAWLPSSPGSALQPPTKLYASFRAFLFQSQAQFVDVPQPLQSVAQQEPAPGKPSLLSALGIEINPKPYQVVQHLLHEAAAGRKVNLEVYTYLDQQHEDPSVARLKDQPCLAVEDGYVRPGQAIRSVHPFGRFRTRLGTDWLRFSRLLDRLGVRAEASAEDAFSVLLEMASDHADRRQMSDRDVEINHCCWAMLAGAIEERQDWIAQLSQATVVSSARHFLRKPSGVYFEDRPGLAGKFDETVRDHTIRRPERAWVAMASAGVRGLSEVVQVRIVECEDPRPSETWRARLQDRWPLVRRVLASLEGDMRASCAEEPPDVWEAGSLKVSYALCERETPAEGVAAVIDPDTGRLLIVRGQRSVETAVARELAFLSLPEAGAGAVAAALKELLVAESVVDAERTLSELGFADVVLGERLESFDEPGAGVGAVAGHEVPEVTGPVAEPDEDHAGEAAAGSHSEAEHAATEDGPDEDGGSEEGSASDGRERSGQSGLSRVKPAQKMKFVGKSFVRPASADEETDVPGESTEHQLEVDRRGTELVMEFERQQGRVPVKMDHFNAGYDIESYDASGAIDRYIEVKSLSAAWDLSNVGLSVPQFQKARDGGDRFWLYVVDNLSGSDPQLHRIQDPVDKVTEYRFDDGWRHAAYRSPTPAHESVPMSVPESGN